VLCAEEGGGEGRGGAKRGGCVNGCGVCRPRAAPWQGQQDVSEVLLGVACSGQATGGIDAGFKYVDPELRPGRVSKM
jgi:hypothetical protein